MAANQVLQKALLLLDRGNLTQGEQEVRRAIAEAESEADDGTLITASCALGDLLVQLGRGEEAKPLLEQVIAKGHAHAQHAYEVRRASELLADII